MDTTHPITYLTLRNYDSQDVQKIWYNIKITRNHTNVVIQYKKHIAIVPKSEHQHITQRPTRKSLKVNN